EMAATTDIEDLTRRKVKARLLTSELAALFAVPIEVMTPLTLFLVPIFDPRLQTSSLAPLVEESQAVASLVSNYPSLARKGEGFLQVLQHFFATSDEILKERLTLLLTKFLPDLPVYELYQNHKTNTHSATLVAGLVSRLSNRA